MKKILMLSLIAIYTLNARGQSRGSRIGGQFGLGEAWFTNSNRETAFSGLNASPKLFFSAGLGGSHQFTKWFALTGNVLLSSKGQSFEGQEAGQKDLFGYTPIYKSEETYRMLYTEVPVLAKVSAGFGNFYLKAFAGPSLGINLRTVHQKVYDDQHYNDENGFTKTIRPSRLTEFALVAGAGMDMELKNEEVVFLDFRINNALSSWGKINGQSAYNNYFSVSVGYLMK